MSAIYNLKETVEYAKDSIVSKTISEKAAGTVTLFAFDKGQGLSEHTAPFDALVQILEGKATVIVGGVPSIVAEGQLIIMPGNVPHALRGEERFKMMLVMIKA